MTMTYEDGVIAATTEIAKYGVDLELLNDYVANPEHFFHKIPGTIVGDFPNFTKGYMETMLKAKSA